MFVWLCLLLWIIVSLDNSVAYIVLFCVMSPFVFILLCLLVGQLGVCDYC